MLSIVSRCPALALALAVGACVPEVSIGNQRSDRARDAADTGAPLDGAVPTAGEPCPDWLHASYTALGPDGKAYPTYHPSVDRRYGCQFGHEHGDDPAGAPALAGRTLPFGYVSALASRQVDATGFKIFRWDLVQRGDGQSSHNGASLLMVVHQGTADASSFSDTHREVTFHYVNPRDGRELHVRVLAPFGGLRVDPCDGTSGRFYAQQAEVPGERRIPGSRCFGAATLDAPDTVPGSVPFEDWFTAIDVGGPAAFRAHFDPHFGVFDPNRYCILQASSCALGRSDERVASGRDPLAADSRYKGVRREAQLNQVWIDNLGRDTAVWTDPFGNEVAAGSSGAIEQFVSATEVRPQDPSTALPSGRDYDPDGSVHAPN
jgi:hypothetical protein